MPKLLEVSELEARVKAADSQPLGLDVLRDCVVAISAEFGYPMTVTDHRAARVFRGRNQVDYEVTVREDAYCVRHSFTGDHYEELVKSTETLAWKLCGMVKPSAVRAATERARQAGVVGNEIPINFFREGNKAK